MTSRPGQARPGQAREEFNLADLILELAFLLFVELPVVALVERRNFVSVVPATRKRKPGPMSFQNIRVMYIQTV